MKFLGVDVNIKNVPPLDEGFIPLGCFYKSFLKTAAKPLSIAIYRKDGIVSVYDTFIQGTPEMEKADQYFVEVLVKSLLWIKGGAEIVIYGDEKIADYIKGIYSEGGKREFDSKFMSRVYEKPFTVKSANLEEKVEEKENPIAIGGHLNGCRIGFDAGGSDRKVSAVIDGKVVYSEETVWFPKENCDIDYHFSGILESFKSAASKMPRVDAIGISSAGIYIDNRAMVASLFIKIPEENFDDKVKEIYIRAAKEIGNIPIAVANDGDITALAGAMELKDTNILGIAMGTSEAAGYIDCNGNITGWLNELAFVPVDCKPDAALDEWSGDIGCGVKYFSQDSVIILAEKAGIQFKAGLSPAEKLKIVQNLMESKDAIAIKIYESIGIYLGHTINLYSMFYNLKHILLLGRVMSGTGGSIIVENAKKVLEDEYSEIFSKIKLHLPDENSRRVGQSVAAASIPKI